MRKDFMLRFSLLAAVLFILAGTASADRKQNDMGCHAMTVNTEIVADMDKPCTEEADSTEEQVQRTSPREELVFYYHTDHLDSTRLVLDSNGVIAERLMFLPTGEVFKDERNSSYYHSDFLFSGKELDAETGNYYYGARYYAPRIGIWLSPDPLQLKYPHISSYAYCAGNPVKFIDDFGEKIVLAGNHQQRMTVLTYMQKLTNDKLGVGKDGTVYILEKGVRNTNRSLAIGTNLIADIINNKRTMTITNNRKEVISRKIKSTFFHIMELELT